MSEKIKKIIKDNKVKYVDLRFTDTKGKEQHVTIPAREVTDGNFFKVGKMFDGSSIAGWKGINESDMVLMPNAKTAVIDPFYEEPTLNIRCNIVEPLDMSGYDRDPRSIGEKAEAYLKSTGIGDKAFFGPEPEFFIFDNVRWLTDNHSTFFKIDSEEADWNTGKSYEGGNMGHRPSIKGGYFPVPPVDACQDIRSTMCEVMEEMGLKIEAHHHEVATAGQNEIATAFNSLVKKADEVQILKYVVHNVAHSYGQTATFMPKPIVGDNGSGMHVHQSISKDGVNTFSGDSYAGLSQTALYYIGGIIKHAKALNAFTNASTNSYKRLVPGFEAPVMLAYSARNRSASIRIPVVPSPKATRIEVRFPDPTANPYLAFSAMLMAGIDGILNKIDPGKAHDMDLYELTKEQEKQIPQVCYSLEEALQNLDKDRAFLNAGGVFSNDFIDSYIALKMEEVSRMHSATHPAEFDMYYSV